MIRGVGFDFDHTLGVDRQLERTVLLDIIEHELHRVDLDGKIFGPLVDEALHAYRSDGIPLDAVLHAFFTKQLSLDADVVGLTARFRTEAVHCAPQHVQPLPGAREVLEALDKGGIRTAILTNGWSPLQQRKADIIGYTGPVLVSDDLGVRKPDGRAFAQLAKTLDLRPEEIMYVGDSPQADVAGALAAGMHATWFDWEGHPYPENVMKPTSTIFALNEILGLLTALSLPA